MEQKRLDSHLYYLGAYNMRAFAVVLDNGFGGNKGKKLEYFDEPFYSKIAKDKETQEEKDAKNAELIFKSLSIMKTNFELSHKREEKEG